MPHPIVLALTLVLAALSTQAASSSFVTDAVRGCWIERQETGGAETRWLRLLPDHEQRDRLTGHIAAFVSGETPGQWQLDVARDGSQWRLSPAANDAHADDVRNAVAHAPTSVIYRPLSPSVVPNRAVYESEPNGARLVVETGVERLKLTVTDKGGASPVVLFDGARDGCD